MDFFYQIWKTDSSHRTNYWCLILGHSVRGLRLYKPNFPFSNSNLTSLLQEYCAVCTACDH